MEDVLFIVNPNAGSGRTSRVWSSLCDCMPSLRAASLVQCDSAGSARDAIIAAYEQQVQS